MYERRRKAPEAKQAPLPPNRKENPLAKSLTWCEGPRAAVVSLNELQTIAEAITKDRLKSPTVCPDYSWGTRRALRADNAGSRCPLPSRIQLKHLQKRLAKFTPSTSTSRYGVSKGSLEKKMAPSAEALTSAGEPGTETVRHRLDKLFFNENGQLFQTQIQYQVKKSSGGTVSAKLFNPSGLRQFCAKDRGENEHFKNR